MADALIRDAAELGLRRVVVPTRIGPVVARAGDDPAEGPGLLLLHGAAGSWTTWTPLLQHAAGLGRPVRGAVALDLPGWGESPLAVRPTDVRAASAAVAEVARATGYERWHVVGHSLGGFLALDLAAAEPDATAGVVLVSPTGPGVVDAVRRPVAGGMRLPWFAGMLLAMRTLDALPHDGRAVLHLLGRAAAFGPLSAPLFADPSAVDVSVGAAFAEEVRPPAFIAAARAAARYDLRTWRTVTCAVRSVRGVRDVFAGPRDAALLGRLLPDFAEEVVEGAGHFAHVERPDAVLRALASLG